MHPGPALCLGGRMKRLLAVAAIAAGGAIAYRKQLRKAKDRDLWAIATDGAPTSVVPETTQDGADHAEELAANDRPSGSAWGAATDRI